MVAASDPRRLPVLKGIEADCESDEEPTVDVVEVRGDLEQISIPELSEHPAIRPDFAAFAAELPGVR